MKDLSSVLRSIQIICSSKTNQRVIPAGSEFSNFVGVKFPVARPVPFHLASHLLSKLPSQWINSALGFVITSSSFTIVFFKRYIVKMFNTIYSLKLQPCHKWFIENVLLLIKITPLTSYLPSWNIKIGASLGLGVK